MRVTCICKVLLKDFFQYNNEHFVFDVTHCEHTYVNVTKQIINMLHVFFNFLVTALKKTVCLPNLLSLTAIIM